VSSADTNYLRIHHSDICDCISAAIECSQPWRNLAAVSRVAELSDEACDYVGVVWRCLSYGDRYYGNSLYL
jgi:hypothetical protein